MPVFLLPDIVFLDLNMPGKNGKECLKEIKENPRFKALPVIIYSTSAHTKDIMDTHSTGANLYIRKPSSMRGLISVIRRVFLLELETLRQNPPLNSYFITPDGI
ncbi:MAG: response regulator [Ferruginibacter sp.]